VAHLIKIGNSQGIRIPQPLINKAGLQDKEFEIQVVDNGLLNHPYKKNKKRLGEQFKNITCFLKLEHDF